MTTKIDAGHAQDAFHYALMAAGGYVDGYESAFVGSRGNDAKNEIEWYRKALDNCSRAGVRVPSTLSRPARSNKATRERAERLVRWFKAACEKEGLDANQGESINTIAKEEMKWGRSARATAEYLTRRYPEFFATTGNTVETVAANLVAGLPANDKGWHTPRLVATVTNDTPFLLDLPGPTNIRPVDLDKCRCDAEHAGPCLAPAPSTLEAAHGLTKFWN